MSERENGVEKAIGRAVGSVALYSACVYASGWIYAWTYFRAFGASWLVPLMSPAVVVSVGGVGLALLGVAAIVHVTDAWNRPASIPSIRRSRLLRVVLRLVGVALIASGMIGVISDVGWSAFGLFVGAGASLLYAVGLLGGALSDLRAGVDSHLALLKGGGFLLFGVVLFPTFLGRARSAVDLDPARSNLPQLELSEEFAADYRALLVTESQIFGTRLSSPSRVVGFTWEDVRAVVTDP